MDDEAWGKAEKKGKTPKPKFDIAETGITAMQVLEGAILDRLNRMNVDAKASSTLTCM